MPYTVSTKLTQVDSTTLAVAAKRAKCSGSELIREAMKDCVEGRISLDPEEKEHHHKTSMSLDEDTYRNFKKIAADNNLTIDEAIAQLIRKGVKNH